MLEYDRIEKFQEVDANKKSASKECNICHYCYVLRFKFRLYICNGCLDLTQKSINP